MLWPRLIVKYLVGLIVFYAVASGERRVEAGYAGEAILADAGECIVEHPHREYGEVERGISEMTTVTNGVNVQALLDAREVLKGAPEAAQFTWRASAQWQNGVHSQIKVNSFFGLGEEQNHLQESVFEADHPEVFAATDNGITPIEFLIVGLASCLTAGVASVAENRGIQLRSVDLDGRRRARHPRDPRCRQRRPQRLQRHQGDVQHRCGRVEGGHRGAGGPVPEAFRRVRRPDEPDERHRRGRLRGSGGPGHRTHNHRRRRRGARGPRRQPLPRRTVGRPRRARAR